VKRTMLGKWMVMVDEVEVYVGQMKAEVCEVQVEGEVGKIDGEVGGMKAEVCEEDPVGQWMVR